MFSAETFHIQGGHIILLGGNLFSHACPLSATECLLAYVDSTAGLVVQMFDCPCGTTGTVASV